MQVSDRQAKKRDGEGEKEEDGEEGSVDSEGSNEGSALLRNDRVSLVSNMCMDFVCTVCVFSFLH